MQQVATFGLTFEEAITIDGKMQGIGGKFLATWNLLRQTLSAQIHQTPRCEPHAPSGYYGGAYDRARASMPMASLRELA